MDKINAVIYARFSSHAQREESIEGQLRKCHEYARQNGFCVIHEYCDRALSGKTDNRPEFQQMIKDSEKHTFQAVIMYTIDRFARNRYDAATYKSKLKKNGVRLYYTEQALSDEPESIILEAVLEGMAEYYSENLARGVKRGMNENALKGMSNGGTTAIGLKIENKRYIIDPKYTGHVTLIFDLIDNGLSQRDVVKYLDEHGYRTPKGNKYSYNTIYSIIHNKKYIGIYTFNGVEVEGGIPPTVSKEQFERCQQRLTKNKRTGGHKKAPERYLLTGKLYCGQCGSRMVGESGTSGTAGEVHRYYKCYDRKRGGTCTKHTEKKDLLERLVIDKVVSKMLEPGIIEDIAEKTAALSQKEASENSALLELNRELADVQKAIRNLLALIEKGVSSSDVTDRIGELTEQKEALQKRIGEESISCPIVSAEQVAFHLRKIVSGDLNDLKTREQIVDTLINKIYVFDPESGGDGDKTKIVVFCNTSSELKCEISLSAASAVLKSSNADPHGSPRQSNPNFFFFKYCFGFIIQVQDE